MQIIPNHPETQNYLFVMLYISFTILENVTSIRDLSALFDQKLDFADHVSSVVTKANRELEPLIRTFRSAPSGAS